MPSMIKLPSYEDYFVPAVESLKSRGGAATISQIDGDVADALTLSMAQRELPHGQEARTELQYRLAWVRTYLKFAGAAENIGQATWRLTPAGSAMSVDEIRSIYKRISAERRAARTRKAKKANKKADSIDISPPSEPLSPQNSAVRFAVVSGRLDVRPTQAWEGYEHNAAVYLQNALLLAERLKLRLDGSNTATEVSSSVEALLQILGNEIDHVQPDLLRMAARSVSAKAKAYGHPQAIWELSPDAVSLLFELESALVDLQSFVKSAVIANEADIRSLDLTPDQAAFVKEAIDELTVAVVGDDVLLTHDARAVLETAQIASEAAGDQEAIVNIEASRLLVFESLTRTLATAALSGRNLESRNSESNGDEGRSAGVVPVAGSSGQGGPTNRRPSIRRPGAARSGDVNVDSEAWSRFVARVLKRLEEKGPDKVADAVIDAIASTIRHAPKTILGFGAAVAAMIWSGPVVLGTGALTIAASWIGYEAWKRKNKPK